MINTMGSGLPVNLNYGPASQFSVSNLPTYRPNITGDPLAPEGQRNIDNYFNKANVLIPVSAATPNPFGNAGRNTIIGPKLVNLDFSATKNFPITRISDSFNVQFRAEIFNILNRANFSSPTDNLAVFDQTGQSIQSAGLLTSTQTTSRQIQFALKLIW